MDLQIKDQLFLVGGAGSGFGKAIAETLLAEQARVIAVARRAETLEPLAQAYPAQVTTLAADLSEPSTLDALDALLGDQVLSGMVINAGGPPAKTVLETSMEDWDNAYRNLLRWKVALIQRQVPRMIQAG
jgi:3-oxoacyl-[acyl-carrier protein] reductase